MQRSLSAPGKLFLSGEYAVLWGGTARIAAVGPRMHAEVRTREDSTVQVLLEQGCARGRMTPAGVAWEGGSVTAPFAFVARALDLAVRTVPRESVGFDLALSPSERTESGQKLGLGGSARASLLAVEAARYVLEQRWDPLRLALLAHAEAQGGKGSGGDVAAIFAGGWIRYRRFPVEALHQAALGGQLGAALATSAPVDILRLAKPRVRLSYAFAGESSSTPQWIRRVEQSLSDKDRNQFVDASEGLGAALEESLLQADGDFFHVTEAVSALQALLVSIGALETEPMKRILAIARSYGSVGKMSGAGGGDGCVLFSPDEDARRELLTGLRERGFETHPLELEPGLQGEMKPHPLLLQWLSAGR